MTIIIPLILSMMTIGHCVEDRGLRTPCTMLDELKSVTSLDHRQTSSDADKGVSLQRMTKIILLRMNCGNRYNFIRENGCEHPPFISLPSTLDQYLNQSGVMESIIKFAQADTLNETTFPILATTVLVFAVNFERYVCHHFPDRLDEVLQELVVEDNLLNKILHHYHHGIVGVNTDDHFNRLQCINAKEVLSEIHTDSKNHRHEGSHEHELLHRREVTLNPNRFQRDSGVNVNMFDERFHSVHADSNTEAIKYLRKSTYNKERNPVPRPHQSDDPNYEGSMESPIRESNAVKHNNDVNVTLMTSKSKHHRPKVNQELNHSSHRSYQNSTSHNDNVTVPYGESHKHRHSPHHHQQETQNQHPGQTQHSLQQQFTKTIQSSQRPSVQSKMVSNEDVLSPTMISSSKPVHHTSPSYHKEKLPPPLNKASSSHGHHHSPQMEHRPFPDHRLPLPNQNDKMPPPPDRHPPSKGSISKTEHEAFHDHQLLSPHQGHLHSSKRREFEQSLSTIALAILKGYRIRDDDLPCPISFLESIFDTYGKNGIISIEGVRRLTKTLGFKPKSGSSEHDHHEQKHKHHKRRSDQNHGHAHAHGGLQHNVTCESFKRHLNKGHSVDKQCYLWDDLESILFYKQKHMTRSDFLDICPVILQQISSNGCSREPSLTAKTNTSNIQKYGISTLCVFLISLCSFAGAMFVKCAHSTNRAYFMASLLALSVGCLLGDAILHLLPHVLSQGGYNHSEVSNIYRLCGALISVHGFFLIELFFKHSHSLSRRRDDNVDIEISRDTHSCVSATSATSDIQLIDLQKNNLRKAKTENKNRLWQKVSTSSTEVQPEDQSLKKRSPSSLKWMILIGEMVHNFADGMAIGASFAVDLAEGLSTSVAVFCHELPHELGDFAALLSTGMSTKKALLLNFASSLTAFVGLYIGVVIGSNEEARLWIISFGAGMFMYVALVTLMPELISHFKCYPNLGMFFALNIGLLLGYSAMLLLAVFEHDIKLTL